MTSYTAKMLESEWHIVQQSVLPVMKWKMDRVELDEICGIGPRIKKRLNNMGVFNFKQLRQVPLKALLASLPYVSSYSYVV